MAQHSAAVMDRAMAWVLSSGCLPLPAATGKKPYSTPSLEPTGHPPAASLVPDSEGNLYGTTLVGGKYPCGGSHCGVVFRLSPSGSRWRESVLYNFTNASDGSGPSAGVIFDSTGNLWGTTNYSPGACMFECGQVFQLKRTSGGWTIGAVFPTPNSLPSFGGLIRDAAGNLYGTVADDHYLAYGNVFELTP
jgi:uncharacterized repeat protein (TIGR03803 family)